MMKTDKRKIDIFSAGCPLCEEAVALVEGTACSSCEVTVLDLRQEDVVAKAKEYGVGSVPAVAIDGKLAGCCAGRGPNIATLKTAGHGKPIA